MTGRSTAVTVIDYNAGNITSVERALAFLGVNYRVASEPEHLLRSGRVIFPGVGAAGHAMNVLRERNLDEALKEFVALGRPLLGICLGAQILLEYSHESIQEQPDGAQDTEVSQNTVLLGIIPGCVLRFPENLFEGEREIWCNGLRRKLKVPHIGWNTVHFAQEMVGLFRDVPQESSFYFDHSYYLSVSGGKDSVYQMQDSPETCSSAWGLSVYGIDFVSVVGKENIVGMQFHPEKSGPVGLKLIDNFLSWG